MLKVQWVPSLTTNSTLTSLTMNELRIWDMPHPWNFPEENTDTWVPEHLKRPCTSKPGARTEIAWEKAVTCSKTNLHPSIRIKATPSILKGMAQHVDAAIRNTQSFQDHHFLERECALKKLGFRTLWATILTGLYCRKSEGTKETARRHGTKVQGWKTQKNSLPGLPLLSECKE